MGETADVVAAARWKKVLEEYQTRASTLPSTRSCAGSSQSASGIGDD
jgi:hypothetical protein